jgi:hypothetical protein
MKLLKQPTKMFEADCITTVSGDDKITTAVVMMPRFVLAEITRHKSFSFSVASSRAVPTKRCIETVRQSKWVPTFRANQAGMVPGELLSGPLPGRSLYGLPPVDKQSAAATIWGWAKTSAVENAFALDDVGAHKQWVNRLLEPFAPTTVVMTASHRTMVPAGDKWLEFKPWENFFRLRISEHAQDEIRAVAESIQSAMQSTKWAHDEAHTPLFYEYPKYRLPEGGVAYFNHSYSALTDLCAAQMARVSYARNDLARPAKEDRELASRLRADGHMSPFEHVAMATPGQWGPLWGWKSERMRMEAGQ